MEEIPRLLTIKEVKPTLEKISVRVTSMWVYEGQRCCFKSRRNKNKEIQKEAAKVGLKKKKKEMVEVFIKCKDQTMQQNKYPSG